MNQQADHPEAIWNAPPVWGSGIACSGQPALRKRFRAAFRSSEALSHHKTAAEADTFETVQRLAGALV
jgi:hypothetical protein